VRYLRIIRKVALSGEAWINRREWQRQSFSELNERPVEYAFLFRQIAALGPRSVLDVGTGRSALPRLLRTCGVLVTAVDNVRDFWPSGMVNPHWYVLNDDITRTQLKPGYDLVSCISVLEHIREHEAAVRNMLALLNPGGHLVLTCPFTEHSYCPNVYELPNSEMASREKPPYVTQSFSRSELARWLAIGATIVDDERWQYYEGEHWTEGARLSLPRKAQPSERHQIGCFVFRRTPSNPRAGV
jgi:2-polyprenyl-3-methyl-5-hydroxy-6-metoxy-1,4-benzoquinol methylase